MFITLLTAANFRNRFFFLVYTLTEFDLIDVPIQIEFAFGVYPNTI